MKCREFERLLPGMAGSQLESAVRESAMSHAETCPHCAARLEDERALSAGLRALALDARSQTAPSQVENHLRKAFRKRGEPLKSSDQGVPGSRADAEAASSVARLDPGLRHRGRRWAMAPAGLAASVLLLAGLFLGQRLLKEPDPQVNPSQGHVRTDVSKPSAAGGLVTSQLGIEPPQSPAPVSRQHAGRERGSVHSVSPKKLRHLERWSEEVSQTQATGELKTDFLPLMAVRPLSPLEQRQIVRVRLPRSALHVFGLPVNMERSREPVQADVLLGEDGTALAVRFVR
jgi:hypothetical protein